MTDLAKLADAIEQGFGGRDQDADVYEAFGYQVKRAPETATGISWRYLPRDASHWLAMEHITSSIDECSRFIEQNRPAWAWSVGNTGPNDEPHACVTLGEEHDCADLEGSSRRPALALAAALCRAEVVRRGQ